MNELLRMGKREETRPKLEIRKRKSGDGGTEEDEKSLKRVKKISDKLAEMFSR